MTQFIKEFTDTRDFVTTFVTTLVHGLDQYPEPALDAWVESGQYGEWFERFKSTLLGDVEAVGLEPDSDTLAAVLIGFNLSMEVWQDWLKGASQANPLVRAIIASLLVIEPATAKFFADLLGDDYALEGEARDELIISIEENKREHAENCEHCREAEAHEPGDLNLERIQVVGASAVTNDDDDRPIGMYL